MTQLDRYLIARLTALFGFFALVLVSVYWVNRAVSLFDRLIGDGQTAWVVLEFTLLTLPNVIRLVLPVAAFAATLYAVNRLSSDSELVVMQATGASPWRLSRPVAVFGLFVAALMMVLVHVLVPVSRTRLAERTAEISEDVTARFLSEGTFQHPATGVTIYIREISSQGELLDLFLSDARKTSERTTYTAEKALIVRSDTGPKLIMLDGMAQTLRFADDSLSITRFSDLTYDIGSLIGGRARGRTEWNEIPSWRLLNPTPELLNAAQSTREAAHLVLHDRMSQPLMAPAAALLGFGALMLGAFSRFGMWKQITLAIFAVIALQLVSNAAENTAKSDPALWALYYLAPALGAAMAGVMLWFAGRSRRITSYIVEAAT